MIDPTVDPKPHPGIGRGVLAVALIALASAGGLGLLERLTAERIEANETAEFRERIRSLAPGSFPEPFPDVSATSGRWGLCNGLALVRDTVTGYGGPMRVSYTLAHPESPRISRFRVLAHQETPGITDFLETPDTGWLAALRGLDGGSLAEVDTLTGATITSRALLEHLQAALAPAATGLPAVSGRCP